MAESKTEEFIGKAKKVHGDRFDYSGVNYTGAHGKVWIVCKVHGGFQQRATNHLQGKGCHSCIGEVISKGKLSDTEKFKLEARRVHHGFYDYSRVDYKGSKSKIEVICRDHGAFAQQAGSHLSGAGCTLCYYESRRQPMYNTKQFVDMARGLHGSQYDYSNTTYSGSNIKVNITCRIHGMFSQTPRSHLGGSGCPLCVWNRDQPTKVYIFTGESSIKVGISIDPERRLRRQSSSQPFKSYHYCEWVLEDFATAFEVEQVVHFRLSKFRVNFTGFDGHSEWFKCSPEYASEIVEGVIKERSPI